MAKRKNLFDQKFGEEFIKSVPVCPGVYEMLDLDGKTLYVGKAKRLRRRLQQYRNARRCKKHHKMRAILAAAISVRLTSCETDLAALLLENELIQKFKPRFNISGAFSFLYPAIGVERKQNQLVLVYTTSPANFSMFKLYGAYRSRHLTREGFYALLEILSYLGHREPSKKMQDYPRIKFSHVVGFRQIEERWLELLDAFLKGASIGFLEQAIMTMVEKPMARRKAAEVQDFIKQLKRFFKFEARPLRAALLANGIETHSISQEQRDQIFLKSRHRVKGASAISAGSS
jgi:excinuclease UvrABC nuclease subunit